MREWLRTRDRVTLAFYAGLLALTLIAATASILSHI